MVDFFMITTRQTRTHLELYPKFKVGKSQDLMIRGGDFYAIWLEDEGLWSTDEQDVLDLIDRELDRAAEEHRQKKGEDNLKILHMWDAESGMIDRWHKYCQRQCRDSYHMLDEKLIFSNSGTNKKDYASKRLNYPLEPGECPAYEKLLSTLYSPEERHKLEWAIGAILTGDGKTLQKFMVLYGAAGTGKSTVLNIIQQLFEGYYCVFDAKALGQANNQFALEPFNTNPLVAIQHDGDLSRIEDNTRLNSLVSHEEMTINEKFKGLYTNRFKCFLFLGTNKPVKITDGKSGLLRRLIDVTPSGKKVSAREYNQLTKQIPFELGAIACHCRDIYLEDPGYYDDYVPISMMGASNDFYNYVMDSYHVFKREDGTTLKAAWEMYKVYCDEAKVAYPFSQRNFKEELKNYFWDYEERFNTEDGERIRNYFKGFRTDIFENEKKPEGKNGENKPKTWLDLRERKAGDICIFEQMCSGDPAQYASAKETPSKAWDVVTTKLSELDTSKLHYVKVPENHIVIDFDLKNEKGEKDYDLNIAAASTWPATYAETSKGGSGLHLHYIYSGDVAALSRLYSPDIEIKVFAGKSSLRRKLTKCNDIPIATISSGLPLKEEKKMLDTNVVQSEKGLRTTIKKCLNKEIHAGTKPNVDFIFKILEDAYSSGLHYDVSDMQNDIFAFAANSTHQAETCMKLVSRMHFHSDDPAESVPYDDKPIVFYDVEVFPNLFLINWKEEGEGKPIVRMINPRPDDIEELVRMKLVGFNCRRYDNHILYARLMGYTNEQLYNLSQKIISAQKGDANSGLFKEAYNISYTDIYDFAAKKQSLKKWEIELGIHHQELGLPWDQPVPEEKWIQVAEYCDNDVVATEAVWNHLKGDFTARLILANLAGGTPNDTTNSLTTKIIFGKERKPNLVYTNLEETFPGYEFKDGKNMYRGTDLGFGGYVYAEPGMYGNVALIDVASMHPASIIAMNCFGDYTQNFKDIRDARVHIKRGEFDLARTMLGGKLAPFLDDESVAKDLAQALKIAINSVYGLTSASFDNPFRDIRNKNNIVALRGALFMRTLQDEVQARGYKVVHIKTDSIKIADADQSIIDFCLEFAKKYQYEFEHEATYDKMCLVNDAVYIAKYRGGKHDGEWTATGKQFAVPYVYKTLFSHEPIEFGDMCETFAVSKGDLYLDMNETLPDVSELEKEKEKLFKLISDPKKIDITMDTECDRIEKLSSLIEEGHDLHFVGRVGNFTPVKPGNGGGVLYRVAGGKNFAAPGSTGFRWLESEMVKDNYDIVDRSFYNKLVDDAVAAISKYGDFEWFASEDKYFPNIPEGVDEEIPFEGGSIVGIIN